MTSYPITAEFTGVATVSEVGPGVQKRPALGNATSPTTFTATASMSFDTGMINYSRALTANFALPNAAMDVDSDQILVTRSQFWWDKNWVYRRILQVQPNAEGFEVDHPLVATISKSLMQQGKIRPDGADIEVLHLVNQIPETWEILPKKVDILDSYIDVYWPNHVTVPADTILKDTYYIYYGNPKLLNTPEQIEYFPPDWPVQYSHDSGKLTYTRPGQHWEDGIALENDAKATLKFYGSKVRVVADIGPQYGIAEIQIDDGEWQQVDQYYPEELEAEEIFTQTNLSIDYHYIRIRRSGRKNAAATDYLINIKSIDYQRHNNVANVGEEADESLMWGSVIGGVVGNK